MSVKTENIFKDLKKLEDKFVFSYLDEDNELFFNKNKKSIEIFKTETPKSIYIDQFVALRSKMCAFKCGNNNNKLKSVSKTK